MAYARVCELSVLTSHIPMTNIVVTGGEDDVTHLMVKVLHSIQEEHKITVCSSSSCGYTMDS